VGETVAGIALPEGEPGAAADAASGLRAAGGGFERTASVTQNAVAIVGSWQGVASFTFRDRCGGYQDAAASAQVACERAAQALRRYGERLEEARERVRRLQEQAQECVERIEAAEARAADATERGNFASRMAFQSSMASAADAGATAASFRDQAAMAYDDAASARAEADRARDELERLRRAAEDEREAVKDAGRTAAGTVEAALGGLPTVAYPVREAAAAAAAARAKEEEEEEDKPWYEDVGDALGGAASWTGDQAVGFVKGVGEGVVGIGEGGLMLYRLSPTNMLLDNESWRREWENMGNAAQFAWENPGEFGQAVINWEDLSEGRYGEWLGNLGPDAALAVATGGAGTVATRGLRGADAMADVADAARDADRAADAARAADRAADGGADAARASRLADLRAQAAASGVEAPRADMLVYRTYGEVPQGYGVQRGSGPYGESWTQVPLDEVPNVRGDLGLPHFNGGRYVITGRLDDPASVSEIRRALPWEGPNGYSQPGGAPEYLIPDAREHIEILRVEGVNPDF
jgi:chemotaxis protein histidine kinase CheA